MFKAIKELFQGNGGYSDMSQSYSVRDIHDEFDSVEDKLMNSATAMLAELNIETENQIEKTVDISRKLGFTKTPMVKGYEERRNKIDMTVRLARLISYYKTNYPFQKFLTEEELNRICRKYNLIYAPVSNYIENVPHKNLLEINNAKLLDGSHSPEIERYVKIKYDKGGLPSELRDFIKDKKRVPSEWRISRFDGYGTAVQLGYAGPEPEYKAHGWSLEVQQVYKQGYFIAAPKQHFDLKNVELNSEFGYATVNRIVEKDPIVFRYCVGGIQVLSKWGLEASDGLLLNEIDN